MPAHWAAPVVTFIRAEVDVPRGFTLAEIFADDGAGNATHEVQESIFHMLVKTPRWCKPTTEYIRANINLPEPSFFGGSAAQLLNSIQAMPLTVTLQVTSNLLISKFTHPLLIGIKAMNVLNVFNYGDVADDANDSGHMHTTVRAVEHNMQQAIMFCMMENGTKLLVQLVHLRPKCHLILILLQLLTILMGIRKVRLFWLRIIKLLLQQPL